MDHETSNDRLSEIVQYFNLTDKGIDFLGYKTLRVRRHRLRRRRQRGRNSWFRGSTSHCSRRSSPRSWRSSWPW